MLGFARHFKYLLSALFVLCTVALPTGVAHAAGNTLEIFFLCKNDAYSPTGFESSVFVDDGSPVCDQITVPKYCEGQHVDNWNEIAAGVGAVLPVDLCDFLDYAVSDDLGIVALQATAYSPAELIQQVEFCYPFGYTSAADNRTAIRDCINNTGSGCDTCDTVDITMADCPERVSTTTKLGGHSNYTLYHKKSNMLIPGSDMQNCEAFYDMRSSLMGTELLVPMRVFALSSSSYLGFDITLNGNGATSAGTTELYTRYQTGVYTDSALSKSMTTSANPITKPERKYTVRYNANGGTVSTTSATATRSFVGYYSAASGGTQYINLLGRITSAGLTAAKGLMSDTTWHARWSGGSVTLPTPTRAGYTFNGWYTAATGGTKIGAAGASYTPTKNIQLYAQWTACTYTVSYNANGGTISLDDTTATYDVNFNLASRYPNYPGYEFIGWSLSKDAIAEGANIYKSNQSVKNLTDTCGGTVILYAIWQENILNINYTSNNATGGSAPTSPVSCGAGDVCTLPNNTYSRTGYTFAGWGCSGHMACDTNPTMAAGSNLWSVVPNDSFASGEEITLFPKWNVGKYTVTLDPDESKVGSWLLSGYTTSVTATYGSAMPTIANVPTLTQGYTFGGYYTAKNGSGTKYYNADGTSARNWNKTSATTLYAYWIPNTGHLAFDANGGSGTAPSAPSTCTFESCIAPANTYTRAGYTFAGWYFVHDEAGEQEVAAGENIGSYFSSYALNGSTITLYAKWSANCNKITLNNTYYGGTGGTTAIYKKTGSTAYFKDSVCMFPLTSVTVPTKANGSYTATYRVKDGPIPTNVGCIGTRGLLSESTDCNVSGPETWYAQYTCNAGYEASGTSCVGKSITCAAGKYLNGQVASCVTCREGYKCPGVTYTFDGTDQGLVACSGSLEYQDATGQSTCKTVSVGYYKVSNSAQGA
ncbi:MAG: InlB B-repeat-containing protein, partial [Alphaproteobacteria bacterium]|nr:InlB B-repeat-containing protein [Alphaproteobacteria bacterium]